MGLAPAGSGRGRPACPAPSSTRSCNTLPIRRRADYKHVPLPSSEAEAVDRRRKEARRACWTVDRAVCGCRSAAVGVHRPGSSATATGGAPSRDTRPQPSLIFPCPTRLPQTVAFSTQRKESTLRAKRLKRDPSLGSLGLSRDPSRASLGGWAVEPSCVAACTALPVH